MNTISTRLNNWPARKGCLMSDILTPKKAKRLTARKKQPYKMVKDKDGQEWLVNMVIDNGRMMELIKPGTAGKVRKRITTSDYADYIIILGEEDLEGFEV